MNVFNKNIANRLIATAVLLGIILFALRSLAFQKTYKYFAPTGQNFELPAPKYISEIASKWRKQPLSDVEVKFTRSCPLAEITKGFISSREHGIEISIRGTDLKVYLCSNYRGDYGILEYESLYEAARVLENDEPNEVILKYSLVKYGQSEFFSLTGYHVLQPAKFSRTYAAPGSKECCETDTVDRMLMVPLRLVSASRYRCGTEAAGINLSIPQFDRSTPSSFILCTDQARSEHEKRELKLDISYILWQASQYDRRELLITFREHYQKRDGSIRTVQRITGIDFLPKSDFETRVKADMQGGMDIVMTMPPVPAGGVCRMGPSGLMTRISCDRMKKTELKSRQLSRKAGKNTKIQEPPLAPMTPGNFNNVMPSRAVSVVPQKRTETKDAKSGFRISSSLQGRGRVRE
ncbi:MAG: hypothetical protein GY847_39540 [Proteobacteria bacterium]|nr:hypothetical protein [Pseudomonadota bacterium]